jgi:uncharacterized membrane protein YeaQ/YmgE (transglycosylase-associated protein family)
MGYLLSFVVLVVVAGLCGSIGMALVGRRKGRKGCLVSVAAGFIGALIGTLLARWADLPEPLPLRLAGTTFPVVWSVVGSAVFVAVLSFLSGRR